MLRKPLVFLVAIFLLGAVLRFYNLGEVPSSFHRDEAFLGYNGYSILKTGRSMSGELLPLHLKSFIYSPAGYSYFSVPFLFFFGLNPFAARLLSAFFGSLTIIITYLLVKKLFDKEKYKESLALFSSFFLAISPWHINLSRLATESVLVVFFLILGLYFYFFWREGKKNYFLLLSFLSWALTLTFYQAPRSFLPLFVPLLLLFTFGIKKIFTTKALKAWGLYFLLIVLPVVLVLLSPKLSLRVKTVSLFASPENKLVIEQMIREDGVRGVRGVPTRFSHNKPLAYLTQFSENYFAHFSYPFLFTDQGLPDRYRVPLSGLLYLFEIPLILIGGFYLLTKNDARTKVIFAWILLVPIGSALAFDDVPNLQRTLIFFPFLSVLSALGVVRALGFLKKKKKSLSLLLLFISVLVILFSVSFYLHQYYIHLPLYRPWYRHDGYEQLVWEVNKLLKTDQFDQTLVTNFESAPTIFFLFFGHYDPKTFQDETKNYQSLDFDRVDFGSYQFTTEKCPLGLSEQKEEMSLTAKNEKTLYVNSSFCDLIEETELIKEVQRRDGSRVFQIVKLAQ